MLNNILKDILYRILENLLIINYIDIMVGIIRNICFFDIFYLLFYFFLLLFFAFKWYKPPTDHFISIIYFFSMLESLYNNLYFRLH